MPSFWINPQLIFIIVKLVMSNPAVVYIQRERKYSDFSSIQSQGKMCVEEWIAAIKSYFVVCKIHKGDRFEVIKGKALKLMVEKDTTKRL